MLRAPTIYLQICLLLMLLCGPACSQLFAQSETTVGPPKTDAHPTHDGDPLDGLDALIQQTMDETGCIPGLAIGIIQNDKVVFRNGFGFRDVESKLPFTPETPSYIASTTKSFIGLLAQLLSDEGLMRLDETIAHTLSDQEATRFGQAANVRFRDMLTHRSGLDDSAINYALSYTGEYTECWLIDRFAACDNSDNDFRYSNLGYQLYGLALKRKTGQGWKELVTSRILEPLDMGTSGFDFDKVDVNLIARPYMATATGFVKIPVIKRSNTMHAAGGMISTVDDLLKWMRVHMAYGELDDRRVFPEPGVRAVHQPAATFESSYWGYFKRTGYGLGWYLGAWQDQELVHCFGSFPGYRAHLSFMPNQGIGVVILSNESRDGGFLPEVIAMHVYDRLLQVENCESAHRQRVTGYVEMVEKRFRPGRDDSILFGEPIAMPAEIDRHSFMGEFANEQFGLIKIEDPANELRARWGNLKSWLAVNDEGNFVADFTPGGWSRYELEFSDDSKDSFVIEIDGEKVVFRRR